MTTLDKDSRGSSFLARWVTKTRKDRTFRVVTLFEKGQLVATVDDSLPRSELESQNGKTESAEADKASS